MILILIFLLEPLIVPGICGIAAHLEFYTWPTAVAVRGEGVSRLSVEEMELLAGFRAQQTSTYSLRLYTLHPRYYVPNSDVYNKGWSEYRTTENLFTSTLR